MNWRDIVERAGWTFVQGAAGTITVIPLVTDVVGWETLAVGAVSGGVSALLSFIKTVAQDKLGVAETRSDMVMTGHPEPTEDEWA